MTEITFTPDPDAGSGDLNPVGQPAEIVAERRAARVYLRAMAKARTVPT